MTSHEIDPFRFSTSGYHVKSLHPIERGASSLALLYPHNHTNPPSSFIVEFQIKCPNKPMALKVAALSSRQLHHKCKCWVTTEL